jgi:phospholipase/carboxylesterase
LIERNNSEIQDLVVADWTLKVRQPIESGVEQVVMLNHGWTGDERSMWIFASQLPKSAWLIAPRAPYISRHEKYAGYSWVEKRSDRFSALKDFESAKAAYWNLLDQLSVALELNMEKVALVGFSQGAALNYALTFDAPERINALAALAGFAPDGSADLAGNAPFEGKKVFIAHGSQDETVPLEMAQESRKIMESAGADVEYCESNVGHKMGANCFRSLKLFFESY